MDIRKAMQICRDVDTKYYKKTHWTDIYSNEDEIVDDLKKVFVPKNRTAPPHTFIGYNYVYSFAYYVQKGWTLSDKQMEQAKRNAINIKKASLIGELKEW